MDNTLRSAARRAWVEKAGRDFGLDPATETSASSDASFRSYWRYSGENATYVVMDAPAPYEDVRPFLKVTALMRAAGCKVADVYAKDEDQGFLLLEDLGKKTYLDVLDKQNASYYYLGAIESLVKWQLSSKPGVLGLYGREKLLGELELFPQWYVAKHRGFTLSGVQRETLDRTFEKIVTANLSVPNVYVHRDFMPRNLMPAQGAQPAILDYQDALYGPVTYDIASLMRDAFISWDEPFVIDMTIRYWEKARAEGLPVSPDFGHFWREVEWMGLQRHLKVLGIFARINYRDGKPKYLADTPRFVSYVRQTCQRYDELHGLLYLLDEIEGTQPKFGYTY